ncbi:MAG: hypothetical protein SCK70_06865 [bacterium]|nr:hypothetical protein [bacterium]
MKKVQELFVILEDRPRALGELLAVLNKNNIKIECIGVFVDSAKLLVNHVEKAKKILTDHNFAVEVREVIKVFVENKPKELAYIAERIGHVGINISHAYGTTDQKNNIMTLILDVADNDIALSLFAK